MRPPSTSGSPKTSPSSGDEVQAAVGGAKRQGSASSPRPSASPWYVSQSAARPCDGDGAVDVVVLLVAGEDGATVDRTAVVEVELVAVEAQAAASRATAAVSTAAPAATAAGARTLRGQRGRDRGRGRAGRRRRPARCR